MEYTYDAWGNILSTTGSMASTLGAANPFRYRGYYYDAETGFYYLNSRYYDPSSCRFINADSYISTGQGILGNNMYAYCLNSPIVYVDKAGFDADFNVLEDDHRSLLEIEDYAGPIQASKTSKNNKSSIITTTTSRGVGGKGWMGDKTWRENTAIVRNGGTIPSLIGGIPTQSQAELLISQSGGSIVRFNAPHNPPNPHTYPHINYLTHNGIKGTLRFDKK